MVARRWLRDWRVWVITIASCLVAATGVGVWWYNDRSAIESVRADARAAGVAIAPASVSPSAAQRQALATLRSLSFGLAAYEVDTWWGVRQPIRSPDRWAPFHRHWTAADPDRVDAIESAMRALGASPGWAGATGPDGDDLDRIMAWWSQRLLTCPPSELPSVISSGYASAGLDLAVAPVVGSRFLQDASLALATRRPEVAAEAEAIASVLSACRSRQRDRWLVAERHDFAAVLAVAERSGAVTDHLGIRLPTVTEHCLGLLSRIQAPGMMRERLDWLLFAEGTGDLHRLRDECGRRFGHHVHTLPCGCYGHASWRTPFDLRALSYHGGYVMLSMQADVDLHLALMIADLRGEARPADPHAGAAASVIIDDGLEHAQFPGDRWFRSSRLRRFALRPGVAAGSGP